MVSAMNTTLNVRITVRGRLGNGLAAAFDGMTPAHGAGTTELVGEVADQAQLHSLLSRIRDLGLELECLTVIDAKPATTDKEA